MKFSIIEQDRLQKTEKLATLFLWGLSLFCALVCTPISIWSASDVLIKRSIFPQLWDFVQSVLQFAFYWGAFSFLIYLSAEYGLHNNRKFIRTYVLCASARYLLSLLVGFLMGGWSSIFENLLYMLLDIALDCLQLLIVVWMISKWIGKERLKRGAEISDRFFNFKLPTQKALFFAVLLPNAIRILSRIRYDIFIGAPQGLFDLIGIIVFYLFDILIFFIAYLLALMLVGRLRLNDKIAKEEFKSKTIL